MRLFGAAGGGAEPPRGALSDGTPATESPPQPETDSSEMKYTIYYEIMKRFVFALAALAFAAGCCGGKSDADGLDLMKEENFKAVVDGKPVSLRSEEHTSELQSQR